MQYSDLRDHAAQLGRFANIREKAEEPSDRIVVQCYDDSLVFVAGCDYGEARASLKVLAGEAKTKGMAVIAARPLLTAAKALKGKGEVDFEINPDGIVMRTAIGGEIRLPNISIKVPDLIRVNKTLDGVAELTGGLLGRAAKLFDVTLDKAYGAWKQIEFKRDEDCISFRGGTMVYSHTEFKINTATSSPLQWNAIHPNFFDAVKDLDDGLIMWGPEQLAIMAGPYFAVTNFMPNYPDLPPFPVKGEPDTKVIIDRKQLVESIKTIGGEKVSVLPTKGGVTLAEWPEGKARLNLSAETSGHGYMATLSEQFAKLVNALGGDKITIEWHSASSGPLWVEGKDGFAILGRVPLT